MKNIFKTGIAILLGLLVNSIGAAEHVLAPGGKLKRFGPQQEPQS